MLDSLTWVLFFDKKVQDLFYYFLSQAAALSSKWMSELQKC